MNLRNGIERYDAYRDLLAGKKVGVVANHTSRMGEQHGVDFLREQGVDVIRVFAPEHGFRGTADAGETIKNDTDVTTGLPIVSLYGKNKKPQPADLKGIEVMVGIFLNN